LSWQERVLSFGLTNGAFWEEEVFVCVDNDVIAVAAKSDGVEEEEHAEEQTEQTDQKEQKEEEGKGWEGGKRVQHSTSSTPALQSGVVNRVRHWQAASTPASRRLSAWKMT